MLAADDAGVHEQRVAEAPRAVGSESARVVDHVGENVGADLQLGEHARLVVEIVRAGAAAGDDRAGEAGSPRAHRGASPSTARAASDSARRSA